MTLHCTARPLSLTALMLSMHATIDVVRPLAPNEKPLNMLRRCLAQFGYTDQDKLDELSGRDNSFLCRFIFAENGVPLLTVCSGSRSQQQKNAARCIPLFDTKCYQRI